MWTLKSWTNEPFAYWENAFTNEEIDSIVELANKLSLEEGTILRTPDGEINKEVRSSKICWITPENKEFEFVFRRLTDIVVSLNEKFFQYDLDYIEDLQFTEYDSEYSGFYGCHKDAGYNTAISRKLSFTIQLSDEKDYEGGEVYVYSDNIKDKYTLPKKKGTVSVFPSYILHEVAPVTKGKRNALVSWVHGPRFR